MNSKSRNNSSKKGKLTATFPSKLRPKKFLVIMIMQFLVSSVKHGSTSTVSVFTILTTNVYKVMMSLSCTNTLFPFDNLNNQSFLAFIGDNFHYQ